MMLKKTEKPIDDLISSIEILFLVVERKINKGQVKELILKNDKLDYLIKLFDELVTDEKHFPSEKNNPSHQFNFSEIDFNNLKIEYIEEGDSSVSEPNLFFVAEKKYSFGISSLYKESLSKLWIISLEKEHFQLNNFIYEFILHIIDRLIELKKEVDIIDNFIRIFASLTILSKKYQTQYYINNFRGVIYGWYTDLVFSKKFDIKLLQNFRGVLWQNIQYSVNQNYNELLEHFINQIISDSNISSLKYNNIQGNFYESSDLNLDKELLRDFDKRLRQFYHDSQNINTAQHLEKFLKDLGLFEKDLTKNSILNAEYNSKIVFKMKETALKYYKLNTARFDIIKIGSYAIFLQNYELVRRIIEFNQPPDSEAQWTNVDITPTSLIELSIILLKKDLIEMEASMPYHHGFARYFYEYILILHINAIRLTKRYGKDIKAEIPNLILSINSFEHGNFLHYYKELLRRVGFLGNAKNTSLKITDEEIQELTTLFNDIIIAIEDDKDISDQSRLIEPQYVQNFIDLFLKTFNEFAQLKNIHGYYNNLKIHDSIDTGDNTSFIGINEITSKGFFSKTPSNESYLIGNYYPELMAYFENNFLLSEYDKFCDIDTITEDQVLDEIKGNSNDKIIISYNLGLRFKNIDKLYSDFKYAWDEYDYNDYDHYNTGYIGSFKNGSSLYELRDQSRVNKIYFIAQKDLGFIHQLPVTKTPESINKHGDFLIEIMAFNEHPEEVTKILETQPNWLQQYQTKEEKISFLKNSVRVKIFEKLKIVFNKAMIDCKRYFVKN